MAASAIDSGEQTVVLVGRSGNGKSATGNSILGRKAFKTRTGATRTCQLQKAKLKDGQIINVIDTPGLFDPSAETEFIEKEIVKCNQLAPDGIHAVIVVLSVKSSFSREEEAAFSSLKKLFGSKIIDYVIVVFTGGDALEENKETLEDYLGRDCPEPLKEILGLCENRQVLFNNKTDATNRAKQVGELISLINTVIAKNGGQPYIFDMVVELKVLSKLKEIISKLEQQLVTKFKETISEHEQQLAAKLKETISEHELLLATKPKETTGGFQQQLAAKPKETTSEFQQQLAAKLKETISELEPQLGSKLKETISEYEQQLAAKLKETINEHEQQFAANPKGTNSEFQQKLAMKLKETISELEQQLETKPKEIISEFQQQLAVEQAARLKAEHDAQAAQMNSNAEISKLNVELENAQAAQMKSYAEIHKLSVDLKKAQSDIVELRNEQAQRDAEELLTKLVNRCAIL